MKTKTYFIISLAIVVIATTIYFILRKKNKETAIKRENIGGEFGDHKPYFLSEAEIQNIIASGKKNPYISRTNYGKPLYESINAKNRFPKKPLLNKGDYTIYHDTISGSKPLNNSYTAKQNINMDIQTASVGAKNI